MFETKFYQPSIAELMQDNAVAESDPLLENLEDLLGIQSTGPRVPLFSVMAQAAWSNS